MQKAGLIFGAIAIAEIFFLAGLIIGENRKESDWYQRITEANPHSSICTSERNSTIEILKVRRVLTDENGMVIGYKEIDLHEIMRKRYEKVGIRYD